MERGLLFSGIPVITPDNKLNLESLDPELILLILQTLEIPDIQNFCNITKQHRSLCRSSGFKMMLQSKIEEFKPTLLEMSYQSLLKTCRKYPILQDFCENNDKFWDAKFRYDILGGFNSEQDVVEVLLRLGLVDKYNRRELDKDDYEEVLSELFWENLHYTPEIAFEDVKAGQYLKQDLPNVLDLALERMRDDEYREIARYIVYDLGFPVDDEIIETLDSWRIY